MPTDLTYWCFFPAQLDAPLQAWAAARFGDDTDQQQRAHRAAALVLDFLRSDQALDAGLRKEPRPEKAP